MMISLAIRIVEHRVPSDDRQKHNGCLPDNLNTGEGGFLVLDFQAIDRRNQASSLFLRVFSIRNYAPEICWQTRL